MKMQNEAKESLFQPEQPVNPDRFKGWVEIIENILKYFLLLNQAIRNIFMLWQARNGQNISC